MFSSSILFGTCAVVYAVIAITIVWRSRRIEPLLLAFCCLITAGWAFIGASTEQEALTGIESGADLVRALAWFGFIFYLYHDARIGKPLHETGFALTALCAAATGAFAATQQTGVEVYASVFSLGIVARLGLAIAELLLIENLYFNLPPHARWHVALPSILLGALACFDIVLCADVVLFHHASPALLGARTVAMVMIGPLLIVAAMRGQRGKKRVRLSRSAVFHSATLVLSGSVLLALAAAGEAFRHFGGSWGWLAEVSLVFAAVIAIGLMLTSGSARSRLQRLFVDHFFAERYDYRRQWLSCIATLSGDDGDVQGSLPTRVIRTIVSVVDSPAGALFLQDGGAGGFAWAGSWNMPGTAAIPADHPVIAAMRGGAWIARLDGSEDAALRAAPVADLGPVWLAIPLLHRGETVGIVVAATPRAFFPLEHEVYDLLRIVAKEVATYMAEQRATQTLLQTRQLHDYSKRFAFVAHDIKNVSSQLALLLTNAERHISNPEFQKDMLETVHSSVRKITALLERLEQPEVDRAPAALAPLPMLEALVATYRRVRATALVLEHDGSIGTVAMGAEAFETAVTHLLNNAVESSGRPSGTVLVRVRHEVRQVVVDIVDGGHGMTPEFLRDELFRPFSTSKAGGSGIGAFQARELVRGAGGDLVVISAPGAGTTMRLLLPRTDTPGPAATAPVAGTRAPAMSAMGS